MTIKHLLIAGPAGVGKSTTARALQDQLRNNGLAVRVFSFATPLYEHAARIAGISSVDILRALKEKMLRDATPVRAFHEITGRQLLQKLGQGMRDLFGPEFWADQAVEAVRRWAIDQSSDHCIAIFDDARHPEEFPLGHVIELAREGVTYACDHPSSMPVPPDVCWLRVDLTKLSPAAAAAYIVANQRSPAPATK